MAAAAELGVGQRIPCESVWGREAGLLVVRFALRGRVCECESVCRWEKKGRATPPHTGEFARETWEDSRAGHIG